MSSRPKQNPRSKPCRWVESSFVAFAAQIGVSLTEPQKVLFSVAFDGLEPKELRGELRDIARKLFGEVDVIPPLARAVIAALIGARAGKSFLFSLRLLHLALTHPLNTLAAGEQGFGLLVAPDMRLAKQGLRYIAGAIEANGELKKLVVSQPTELLSIRRDDGRIVVIECLPATRGGSALRGRSLFGAVLDEAAFFRDNNYVVNDEELYKAIAPRVLPGGQFYIVSTPWAEGGLLYELWRLNHGTPTTAIGVHAATTLLRTDEHTLSFVERERERDPVNASREFDAVPMAAGTAAFFDPVTIKACTHEDMPLIALPRQMVRAWCGLDTGFRRDPSSAVIIREYLGRLEIAEIVTLTPGKNERLKPSETIRAFVARAEYHGCESIIADGHYIETVREHVGKVPLVDAPADKSVPYIETRTELAEGRLAIPAGHTAFIQQLRDVVSKPTSGGNLQITSPRKGGAHGDEVSAATLAVWAAVHAVAASPTVLRGGAGVTGSLTTNRDGRRVRLYG